MFYGQPTQVINVNGIEGARAYQMPPNSSVLLLDSSNPIIWLKVTDGAGYPTITPYDIAPHKEPEPVDLNALYERISELERKINESDNATVEPTKRKSSKTANADEQST